jgi:hypothetical protein
MRLFGQFLAELRSIHLPRKSMTIGSPDSSPIHRHMQHRR